VISVRYELNLIWMNFMVQRVNTSSMERPLYGLTVTSLRWFTTKQLRGFLLLQKFDLR
jgi:hypothetical protein